MTSASKRKGSGFEREVVAYLQSRGIAAEKIPLSGAVKGGSFEGDINCPVRGKDWKGECKRRRQRFKEIDAWLGTNKFLCVRDDRSRTLVVVALEDFAEMAA